MKLLLLPALLALPFCCRAQAALPDTATTAAFGLDFSVALRMRSTAMNFFNLNAIRRDVFIPYNYEKNIQQPAAGIKLNVAAGRFFASYVPFVHYGYLRSKQVSCPFGCTPPSYNAWLIDQQLAFGVKLSTRKRFLPHAFSLGYGSINTGKKFYLRNGPYNQYIDMQINTWDIGLGFTPWGERWPIWFTANYMYEGFAGNRVDKMISYTLAAEYRFMRLPQRRKGR